jgi:hypothetical protein
MLQQSQGCGKKKRVQIFNFIDPNCCKIAHENSNIL